MTYYLAKYNDGIIIKGKRRLAKLDEPKANKSASKRLVKLDELANNFAIKREQSLTCLNYAEQ